MSFNSLDFLLLFAAVVILYYLLPQKLRNPLLLIASYVFYAAYNLGLTLFLLVLTLVTYFIGREVDRRRGDKASKRWMILGVTLNLLVLAFYKYFNFFSLTIAGLTGAADPVRIDWLVPLGISFIVFTAVSYLADVYRGKLSSQPSLFKFALYISFFPKIVQGPIERAGDILPQFEEAHVFDLKRYREGMIYVLYGLFMKMVVADTASIVVDRIYGSLNDYSGAAIALATVLFALQIYCDFAGYSYTAIGAAKVLGFEFRQNFRQPYLSRSVAEFWRRWHMSLNRWLTDYLYIPLGGSRCSKSRKNFNVLVTFGLSGLWHGADWGYVIWGLLNGIYIIVESALKSFSARLRAGRSASEAKEAASPSAGKQRLGSFLHGFITFILIAFSWIFFRARNLSTSFTAIGRIFTQFHLLSFIGYVREQLAGGAGTSLYGLDVVYNLPVLLAGIVTVVIVDVMTDRRSIAKELAEGRRWLRWLVSLALIFAVILFGVYGYGYSAGAFIYAGF